MFTKFVTTEFCFGTMLLLGLGN